MVVLKIVALTARGEAALVRVSKMKTMRLAKVVVINSKEVNVIYGKNIERFLSVDPTLKAFAITRGKQMAVEMMETAGADELDFSSEVFIS